MLLLTATNALRQWITHTHTHPLNGPLSLDKWIIIIIINRFV